MAKLVIVESPAKAKTIGKFLGKDFLVKASGGHIIDLPKSTLGIKVEEDFQPEYTLIAAKKELAAELKDVAAESSEVYLATDPDREGEAISWHLSRLLKIPEDRTCRVVFNEITKNTVVNAIQEPRKIDMDLVNAQQARRVLDRLVGYQISPVLWRKVKSGLSAGRVQSVATRLVVDREREIEAFIPQEYWTLDALLSPQKAKKKFTAHFYGTEKKKQEPKSLSEVEEILAKLDGQKYFVKDYKEGTKNHNAFPPFTTSVLQQDASRKLGFTTKKTMMLAQQLYEGVEIASIGAVGLVTYIRTDSMRIAEEAIEEVRAYIEDHYGVKYLPAKPNVFKSKKNIQDAHEAIRPTSMTLSPESIKASVTNDQYKLYKLIFERFIACQMAPAKFATINVDIQASDYIFKASSSKRIFDGYMAVYVDKEEEEKENENALPELKPGEELVWHEFVKDQHFTTPPLRYTEASLVKEMEVRGIGRPSTYAPTISTILDRDYIEREKKNLKPTALGICVTDLMIANFSDIADVSFTAAMEERLDEVEEGKKNWVEIIRNFYGPFKIALDKAGDIERVKVPVEETDIPCEKCGAMMVIRSGRFGKFLACPKYPECKNTKPLPADEVKEPCPKCGGKLVQRRSKKGKKFYGCSNYPNCDFASTGLPTGEKCPECGGFLVHGFRGKILCNNFECKYTKAYKKKETETGTEQE